MLELGMFVGMNKSIVWKGQVVCLPGGWDAEWSMKVLKAKSFDILVNV